jgi:hypothetical protein
MIMNSNTKLSNDATTSEGVTFTLTEHGGETNLMITWANGEDALDYEVRITNRDADLLAQLFKVVN